MSHVLFVLCYPLCKFQARPEVLYMTYTKHLGYAFKKGKYYEPLKMPDQRQNHNHYRDTKIIKT